MPDHRAARNPITQQQQDSDMAPNRFCAPDPSLVPRAGASLTVPGPLPPQSPREGDILRDDALLAGDRVPHAGSTQRVHALHNDKWGFLQCYDAQVVILLFFRLRAHSGPHVVLHLQGLVFPLPYLHRDKGKTQKPPVETGWPLLASPSQLLNKGQRCWLCPW